MIKPAVVAFWALLLFPLTHSASAEPGCTTDVSETVRLFDTWRSLFQFESEVGALAATSDLKSEADRLGRAMEGVDGLNHFHALYSGILRDIAENENPEASMRVADRLTRNVSGAANSLKSLSACLAIAEVDDPNQGNLSLASMAMLMRYVRPDIFSAIGDLDYAMRSTEPLGPDTGPAVWRSLIVVNGFVEVSQGLFSECENLMTAALLRGNTFVVPQEHFTGIAEPAILRLDVTAANMTLGVARTTCNPR